MDSVLGFAVGLCTPSPVHPSFRALSHASRGSSHPFLKFLFLFQPAPPSHVFLVFFFSSPFRRRSRGEPSRCPEKRREFRSEGRVHLPLPLPHAHPGLNILAFALKNYSTHNPPGRGLKWTPPLAVRVNGPGDPGTQRHRDGSQSPTPVVGTLLCRNGRTVVPP